MIQTQTQHQTHSPLRAPLTRTDLIRALDQEVDRLLQARHLLAETLPPGQEISVPLRRQKPQPFLFPQATATVSTSSGGTYTSPAIPLPQPFVGKVRLTTKPARPRRKLSAAARRRISEAQTARWKKFHQQQRAGAGAEKKSA